MSNYIPVASYLRIMRVNTFLMVVAVLSVIGLLGTIGVVIVYLLPLKTIETRYVEFQTSGNNFVSIASANKDIKGNDALISMMLRKYVVDRERVNQIDEKQRYASVYALSTDDVSNRFQLLYGGEDALIYKDGFRREIILGPVTRIASDIVLIDFQTTDTNINKPKQEPTIKQWQATIQYMFSPQVVKHEDKDKNPIGIFVTKYQPSRRTY